MIKVIYNPERLLYAIKVGNFPIGDSGIFNIKFDTGAKATVIGIFTLYEHVSANQISNLKEGFINADIQPQVFASATGHQMSGYPCVANNIELAGENVSKFYFYLVLDVRRKLSLLGDDFISCCSFNHQINSDIHIAAYDKFYTGKNFFK